MNNFADRFGELIERGNPRARTPQTQGLAEGTVVDVYDSSATFKLAGNELHLYGPAPFGRTDTPPQSGDRCLVGFVGNGIDRPWLISWAAPS